MPKPHSKAGCRDDLEELRVSVALNSYPQEFALVSSMYVMFWLIIVLFSTFLKWTLLFCFVLFSFVLIPFIFISWRLITLQYCSGFCHTLTWSNHGFICIPRPDPPSHLLQSELFHKYPLISLNDFIFFVNRCQWTTAVDSERKPKWPKQKALCVVSSSTALSPCDQQLCFWFVNPSQKD